ncbi:AAA family ATPase [Agrobacterium rosae]|uniref:Adenylylsulfate kinase n=1 Tax=Agrobacterium rosae TaxID=1972867 RepID=A0A1R3TZV0_9HYPH|nr:AAA family ATPase [Agrobacterium rosae]SCX33628.1 adenylylsulfate kinase [Agrobacterium rosae]
MLIIFGGLPGSGKSTIAQTLAIRLQATYLRLDTIEQAIRAASSLPAGAEVGPAGYVVLYKIAADNLRLGRTVIADSVNSIEITRAAFRATATESNRRFIEVEVICSDKIVHPHRAESRISTVEGLIPPTWEQIEARTFEPWAPDLRIDTSLLSVDESVLEITNRLKQVDTDQI